MSADQTQLAFEWDCRIMSDNGCGFPAPGLHSFLFKPLFEVGGFEFNKVMLLALLSTLVVTGFFWPPSARPRWFPASCR